MIFISEMSFLAVLRKVVEDIRSNTSKLMKGVWHNKLLQTLICQETVKDCDLRLKVYPLKKVSRGHIKTWMKLKSKHIPRSSER
jgi:hypothetical protein